MRKLFRKATSLLLAAALCLSMAAISPALAADQTLPTTVENCAYSSFDGILDLGFGGNTSDWMGKINQVTVNDVVYTRVDSFGYFESGTKWCIGNATGAFGSYQALKITYNSSFPATIVISADGYNDLTVEVSKKGSSYTAEIKANSSSGGTEEPKPAETYPITVEQAEHGTVSASCEKAAQGGEVLITVTPGEGYELETLTVDGDDVTAQVVGGKYTFAMPDKAVTVVAAFAAKETPAPGIVTVNDLALSVGSFGYPWYVTVANHPGYVAAITEIRVNDTVWEKKTYDPSSGGSYRLLEDEEQIVFAKKDFSSDPTVPVLKSGNVISVTAKGYEKLEFKLVVDTDGNPYLEANDGQGDGYQLWVKLDGTFEAAIKDQKNYDGVFMPAMSSSLTLDGTPKDPGTYLISVTITDDQGRTATSNALPFRVYTGKELLADQLAEDKLGAGTLKQTQDGKYMPLRYNNDKPEKPRNFKGLEVYQADFSSFSNPKNQATKPLFRRGC